MSNEVDNALDRVGGRDNERHHSEVCGRESAGRRVEGARVEVEVDKGAGEGSEGEERE